MYFSSFEASDKKKGTVLSSLDIVTTAGSNGDITGALKTFGDEFVSVEYLLLAILQGNDISAKLLKDAGLSEKGLITAIKELRKGSTISSQTDETQFNALNKYAAKIGVFSKFKTFRFYFIQFV